MAHISRYLGALTGILLATSSPLAVGPLIQSSPAAPAFYVDPAGSDDNTGLSPDTPWQTLAKVNSETIPAGYRVLFKGGATFNGNLVLREGQHFGTPEDPIVFDSYGPGVAIIQTTDNAQNGIDGLNPHDITIQNLHIIGTGSAVSTARGIDFQNDLLDGSKLPGVKLIGLEVEGHGVDGITFRTGDTAYAAEVRSGFNAPLIDSCVVHHCTANAIASNGQGINISGLWGMLIYGGSSIDNITISNCIVHNCVGKTGIGTHSGNAIIVGEVDGGLITHCLAYDNGASGNGNVGIWFHDTTNTIISHCVVRNQQAVGGADGGGFDFDGGCMGCVIEYCVAINCHGSGCQFYQYGDSEGWIHPLQNNILRYCIFENCGSNTPTQKGGISFGNSDDRNQSGNYAYGNVIYQSSIANVNGLYMFPEGQNHRFINGGFFNNIIFVSGAGVKLIGSGSTSVLPTSFLMEGNLYWTAGSPVSITWGAADYATIEAWRMATGRETLNDADLSIQLDPLFAGVLPVGTADSTDDPALLAYQTQAASPARGTGQDLTARFGFTPPLDFFGNVVPQNGFDVGAFESNTRTLVLTADPIPTASVGVPYEGFTVLLRGGQPPVVYSVSAGSLPDGITLDSSTGVVSGTPTTEGASSGIVIRATANGGQFKETDPFDITVAAQPPNLMDGVSWVPYQATLSIVGNEARFVKDQAASPRGAKFLTGLTVGATYRCIGNVYRGTIPNGNGIWFRVTGDQPMTADKLLELTVTSGDIAVNHTFVATATTTYVGAVGLSQVNGEYVGIDDDFDVHFESAP